jgi:hypothetical protein
MGKLNKLVLVGLGISIGALYTFSASAIRPALAMPDYSFSNSVIGNSFITWGHCPRPNPVAEIAGDRQRAQNYLSTAGKYSPTEFRNTLVPPLADVLNCR